MNLESIVSSMKLEDKISLCSGASFWKTKKYEQYGIPALAMCDGPHGLRKQEREGGADMLGVNESRPATCFPAEVTTADSWDVDLLQRIGEAIAREAREQKVGLVLGPGVNLKRNPLCVRNFEYFSEDPYLAGKLAAGFIKGAEEQGIGTSLKHFAVNSQELSRFNSDSILDGRTLRELYLSAFEIAVKEGKPSTLMCSYPKLNGIHCSDNKELLTDILREEWGYQGMVVTDWGAMNDRIEGFRSGCDLNMPGGSEYMEAEVLAAVKNGTLPEECVNQSVRRILKLVFRAQETLMVKTMEIDRSAKSLFCDYEEHNRLAREAAEAGAVLLKNEGGILPLNSESRVAFIGAMAKNMRYQGAGSSHINAYRISQPIEMISQMLLSTIGIFTAALFFINGFSEYIKQNTLFSRVDVRTAIIAKVAKKCNTTSYPNTLEADFIKMRENAHAACEGNNQATEHIWQTITMLLKNIGGLLVYFTILSRVNVILLIVVSITCCAGFFVSRYANNWRYAHTEEEEQYFQKKNYLRSRSESVELAKDIRIFGLQNWLNELLDQIHDLYLDFRLRCERVEVLADITAIILTAVRNGIAYFYLINMALKEGLGVSEFLLYFTAVTTFTEWVLGILREMSILHKESLDISRLREFLDYPEPFRFENGKKIPAAESYELKLENVSFRYSGADSDTIQGLNLTVYPGERLAIVGLNGAGKTTLVKLLCGLLDPTEGAVLLNGEDIREFNRRSYYDLFSAVFQEFSLLDVTVAEQIAQSTVDIDYDKIADCVEKAGLTATIRKLPKGLETHVGREVYLDGVLFSGGQTQRLMLARALYKNGPILLLDEPTAALDPIAENDIYRKYSEMTNGKTSLFISHRLASTRFCNRIIYLADGKIKEEGTHENLLASGGEYAKLFEVQSRYYQEGKEF